MVTDLERAEAKARVRADGVREFWIALIRCAALSRLIESNLCELQVDDKLSKRELVLSPSFVTPLYSSSMRKRLTSNNSSFVLSTITNYIPYFRKEQRELQFQDMNAI